MGDPEKPLRLDERIALRPKEAAAALGVSERAFRSLLPQVPHVRLDGTVLIPTKLLERWLENRATAEAQEADAMAESIVSELRARARK